MIHNMKRWILVVLIAACLILATAGNGAAAKATGEVIGTWRGVDAYSNGENTGSGNGVYQCVEYVKRFYRDAIGVDISGWSGHAYSYYDSASKKGLVAYPNGGSVSPQPGDILVFTGNTYGHVAIIMEVSNNNVKIIEQNWNRNTAYATLSLNGNHIPNRGAYKVKGWLRKPGAQILTQSISPTIISPENKMTFVFSIKNPNSDSIKNVRLGAQVRTHSPVGPWIDSSANDKIVTLSPGTKDYSRTFTFINPELVSSGYYDARWVILDDKTGTWIDSETMTRIFEVKTQSQPPALTPIGDKSVSEKEKLTFRISTKDPDGDKVTYSAEGLPNGAKLTSSGLFTWTPGSGTAGKYTVKFIATANGQTDSETITITVNNPSSALPEITSITPSKTEAGTFDLTIKGKNFNSKTAVEMVYFNGKYVGQGTIKSRSSTKIVVTEKMTGALPGVYVVKVRNNPSDPATESNAKELTITAVPVTLSISPASGKQGTTFSFTGKGYTPNGKIEWHVKKPDGTEFPVGILTASSSGNLKYTYKSNSGSMIGTYNIWAVDQSTGRVSNQVKERIR